METPALDTPLKRQIWRRMKARGWSMRKLSLLASGGRSDSLVKNIFQGKSENPRQDTLEKLAAVFGCEVADLLQDGAAPPRGMALSRIPVIGHVQAGDWREAMEWPEEDRYSVTLRLDDRHPGLPRFGLEIRGPSMNKLYPDGSIVICVRYWDLGREPTSGDRVICQRRNHDGEIEATVKELIFNEAGEPWLWPRSDHPAHQRPIPLRPETRRGMAESLDVFEHGTATADALALRDLAAEEIEIVALVVGSYRPE